MTQCRAEKKENEEKWQLISAKKDYAATVIKRKTDNMVSSASWKHGAVFFAARLEYHFPIRLAPQNKLRCHTEHEILATNPPQRTGTQRQKDFMRFM